MSMQMHCLAPGILPLVSDSNENGRIIQYRDSIAALAQLRWRVSAGSVPCSATNNETPTVLGWGFFLPDRAGSRVFLGVPAEACGLRRSASQPVPGHIPLSPGHSSLRPRSPELARSLQRPQVSAIQIKGLRADESSGWIAASGSKGNRFGCVLSVHIDNYRRNTTSWQHGNFAPDHS